MNELQQMPNIGPVLADLLNQVQINTPAQLRALGAREAFARIRSREPDACFSKLCALAGAVEGVRWHQLGADRKAELRRFFDAL